MKGVAK